MTRRRRQNSGLLGVLLLVVIILVVVSKFIWLLLAFAAAGLVWFGARLFRRRGSSMLHDYPVDEFGPVFPSSQAAAQYLGSLMQTDLQRSMELRSFQILRESLAIALTSKKRDTAESRMSLADETYEALCKSHTIPDELWQLAEDRYLAAKREFATFLYANVARAAIERAERLKTARARRKYLDEAIATLNEGMNHPQSNKEVLRNMISAVPSG